MNRFLQSMEEREAERQKRESKKVSLESIQREELTDQIQRYEKQIECYLECKQFNDAEHALVTLRSLIQDGVETLSLTAFERARTNAAVAKLQQKLADVLVMYSNSNSNSNKKDKSYSQQQEQQEKEKSSCQKVLLEEAVQEKESLSCNEQENKISNNLREQSNVTLLAEQDELTKAHHTQSESSAYNKKENEIGRCEINASKLQSTCKKFSFSNRCKSKMESNKADMKAAKKEDISTADEKSNVKTITSQEKCYGPKMNETLTIAPAKAIFIKSCEKCTIYAFPIAGSAFISDCKECVIYLACHQLRMKNCYDVEVYVACTSHPIIEHCNKMRFGPYLCWSGLLTSSLELNVAHATWVNQESTITHSNSFISDNHYDKELLHDKCMPKESKTNNRCTKILSYPTLEEWLVHVGNVRDATSALANYQCVDDFQWLKKNASPHWCCLTDDKDMKKDHRTFLITVDDYPTLFNSTTETHQEHVKELLEHEEEEEQQQ